VRILVVSTPVGALGTGLGGGVELTLSTLVAGLLAVGHPITVLAPEGSRLPPGCGAASLWSEAGQPQPSWQHRPRQAPVEIPADALLPRFWQRALEHQDQFDLILNLSYDWLPLWLTRWFRTPLCHLISMGSVSEAMDEVIEAVDQWRPERLAFHTATQAADFRLGGPPRLVGNGFDLSAYQLQLEPDAVLGWAGRLTPEKGLEDAARVAARLEMPLRVWGVEENDVYRSAVEAAVPAGTVEWRGFLPTEAFQQEMGRCAVFLNTPKWNEAFGNVVVEAMACGVPVAAYARGGPGELVREGINGALAPADDLEALAAAVNRARGLDRAGCRRWAERHHSREAFTATIEAWLAEVRLRP
jgi:UDP-glucose:tetrahydrobiopterin glucosyltransferase